MAHRGHASPDAESKEPSTIGISREKLLEKREKLLENQKLDHFSRVITVNTTNARVSMVR